jgi:hypothetical protein
VKEREAEAEAVRADERTLAILWFGVCEAIGEDVAALDGHAALPNRMVLARLCKLQRALAVELTVEEFASVDGTRREAVGAVPLHAPILALASVHWLLGRRHF